MLALLVAQYRRLDLAEDALADAFGLVPDERLRLLLLCSHPALAPEAASALGLRLVLGVATDDIARLFLTTAPTIAARITRVKRKLVRAGVPLAMPDETVLAERVGVVASTAYLAFTAG